MSKIEGIGAETVGRCRTAFEKHVFAQEENLTALRLLERNDDGEYLASWTRNHWAGFLEGFTALLASGEVVLREDVEDVKPKLQNIVLRLIESCCNPGGFSKVRASKQAIKWEKFPSNEDHFSHVINIYERDKFGQLASLAPLYVKEIEEAISKFTTKQEG